MQSLGATGTLRNHASSILAQEGLRGLYRGVLPTTLRAGILTSSQLGVYDQAKQRCDTFFFFLLPIDPLSTSSKRIRLGKGAWKFVQRLGAQAKSSE